MYLGKLLSEVYLRREPADDTTIVVIPAGTFNWCDVQMVVDRSVFDDLYIKYRATEPDIEPVFDAIMKQENKEFIRSFASTEVVVERYQELRSKLDEEERELSYSDEGSVTAGEDGCSVDAPTTEGEDKEESLASGAITEGSEEEFGSLSELMAAASTECSDEQSEDEGEDESKSLAELFGDVTGTEESVTEESTESAEVQETSESPVSESSEPETDHVETSEPAEKEEDEYTSVMGIGVEFAEPEPDPDFDEGNDAVTYPSCEITVVAPEESVKESDSSGDSTTEKAEEPVRDEDIETLASQSAPANPSVAVAEYSEVAAPIAESEPENSVGSDEQVSDEELAKRAEEIESYSKRCAAAVMSEADTTEVIRLICSGEYLIVDEMFEEVNAKVNTAATLMTVPYTGKEVGEYAGCTRLFHSMENDYKSLFETVSVERVFRKNNIDVEDFVEKLSGFGIFNVHAEDICNSDVFVDVVVRSYCRALTYIGDGCTGAALELAGLFAGMIYER